MSMLTIEIIAPRVLPSGGHSNMFLTLLM